MFIKTAFGMFKAAHTINITIWNLEVVYFHIWPILSISSLLVPSLDPFFMLLCSLCTYLPSTVSFLEVSVSFTVPSLHSQHLVQWCIHSYVLNTIKINLFVLCKLKHFAVLRNCYFCSQSGEKESGMSSV